MKLLLIFVFYFTLTLTSVNSQVDMNKSSIKITIENFENKKGLLLINVFTSESGFPSNNEKAFQSHTFPISGDSKIFTLENIPTGNYAISILHDENSNFKLDKNIFGIPKEAYAVSNNAKPRKLGPPKYNDAVFVHSSAGTNMNLTLLY